MRHLLPSLSAAAAARQRAVVALVARVYRSAPRQAGAAMALMDDGRILGSVTGGCVESDVVEHARDILAGGPPRLVPYGIADEDALAVGMPCGGQVDIFIEAMDPAAVAALDASVTEERSVAYATVVAGPGLGTHRVVHPGDSPDDPLVAVALPMLARGDSGLVSAGEDTVLVHALAARPAMYVFGAIDHAAALATIGRFLGYRVTVVDARAAFVTRERFPDADELVAEWPHRFLERAPVDARTAICVLTHDARFDVPALQVALTTDAGYIGAMGSRRTTARRRERLVAEGAPEDALERIHAPIGLAIGSKTPQEVAIAIGAQIVQTVRTATPALPVATAGAG